MDVKKETENRLKKCYDRLNDLEDCLKKQNLSNDCKRYLQSEIDKAQKNANYYSYVLDLF